MCLSVVVLRSLNYSLASGSALHTVLQKGACLYEVAVVTTSGSSQVFQIGGKLNVIINYLLVEAANFLLQCTQNVLDIVGPKVRDTRISSEGFKPQV